LQQVIFLIAPVIMNALDLAGMDITEAEEPVTACLCVSVPEPLVTSDMFATPSSSASGSTGGGKVGTTLGLMVLVNDILDVCGGVISGPGHTVTKFCIKPSGLCLTKGHRNKVILSHDTFYIKHSRAGQARFEPNLPRTLMPEEIEVEDLLGKEKVFVEWLAYFAGLKAKRQAELTPNARSGGSLEPWEKIETPILEVFTQANRTLKTPKRLRLGALQAVDIATLPMPNERVEQFSTLETLSSDDDAEFLEAKIQHGLRTVFAK
jgi:hypothetical protein